MTLWTAPDAAKATGGKAVGDWSVSGISIDTRSIEVGDLFVALKAARDGHEFVAQALAKGAGAALVTHVPEGVAEDAPLLVVEDVLSALEDLGRTGRARTEACVVAITGSVGKTSTKEMLRDVLSAQGRTHASVASYNNHWGVPLTLARMPQDTEFAVIEIGMNHPGEIAPLSEMVQPHVAVITTVAPAHMEAFESLEGIAREKANIVAGLMPEGAAILPADVPTIDILVHAALAKGATVVGFGETADAFRLTALEMHHDVTVIKARLRGAPAVLRLNTLGRHFAVNAMGVLAAVEALSGDPTRAAVDLFRWQTPAGRGRRETISLDPADTSAYFELIDDAYNANPASMAAALEVLAACDPQEQKGQRLRRIAILGDMLELGQEEAQCHAQLASNNYLLTVDVVHCVGPRMRACYDALPAAIRGRWVPEAQELASGLGELIAPGDRVLVKGSLGSKVSMIVDLIRKLGHRSQP